MKPRHGKKLRVKKLQNSPYAISEDEFVGKGSFATIKRAYNLQDLSESLAVKIISLHDQQTSVTIKSELQMLKALSHHPNLVNFVKLQISTEKNLYVIMEYCNQGNLQKYIHVHKDNLPQEKIWFFLKQFCEGYKVIYNKNIVHRDIKPENVLIHNGDFKIADFGFAKIIENVEVIQNMSSKGTPLYMAPQLHLEQSGNSKIDIFSIGVILYRLAFKGKYPFFDQDRTYRTVGQYFKQLMLRKLLIPENHGRSKQLVDLIKNMLQKQPEQRTSWQQLFQNKTIKLAVRNQRKKQMVSMEAFNLSLISAANHSVAKVEQIQSSDETTQKQPIDYPHEKYITIQQAFQKQITTNLEHKLCQSKILYTLIDIANRRIIKTIQKQQENIHKDVLKQLQAICHCGLKYSLSIIRDLQDISGQWQQLKKGDLLNFQDIFENDREIIIQKMRENNSQFQLTDENDTQFYIEGTYEDLVYNFLTEFQQYPELTKSALMVTAGFLIQIYDMALLLYKLRESLENQQFAFIDSNNQNDLSAKFSNFIASIEVIKQVKIMKRLKKMGMLIV